jgi:hypothetical protein
MKVWMWHWRPQANEKENSSLFDIEDGLRQHLHCTKRSAVQVWQPD